MEDGVVGATTTGSEDDDAVVVSKGGCLDRDVGGCFPLVWTLVVSTVAATAEPVWLVAAPGVLVSAVPSLSVDSVSSSCSWRAAAFAIAAASAVAAAT